MEIIIKHLGLKQTGLVVFIYYVKHMLHKNYFDFEMTLRKIVSFPLPT